MRLIDADRLLNPSFTDMFDEPVKMTMFSRYAIESQPTVKAIPLDKPFCKMVYGDYVVYNKKWLVNHLQTEWNILQGKEYKPAIPVEWIKEHYAYYGLIKQLIEEWEKENDVNR